MLDLLLSQAVQRKHLLLLTLCWSSVSLAYYLLLFHVCLLGGGNLYLNGFVLGLAELCGNLLFGSLLVTLGLRTTLIASFTLQALASVVYLFPIVTVDIWYGVILFVLKMGVTCAFAGTFYGTNALFNSEILPIIFAVCNMCARLITMGAPIVATAYGDVTVMAAVMACGLMGVMCSGFIEEKKSRRKKKKKKKRNL